ncbi:MAG: BREX-1 system phosphatase PglZ type A, partial [Gammaproteobacteria bacterium]|nr:BREX-1 system phosphatase PglZ type A [Gammaproteobacteria bacterium]
MSNIITNNLLQHLSQHRYVFWHDTDQQAETDTLESLPDNVVLIQIDEMPTLAIKAQVKASREQNHFLFYSQQPQPAFESDWLLNLRLQAKTFYADAISMQMESLGVVNQGLREHLKQRAKFLRAKDRLNKLSRLTNANDDALQLDLKMMTVLAAADQADIAQLLFKIIATTAYQLENDLDVTQNPLLDSFEDYGLASSFWSLIDVHFGYSSTQPTIMDLLVKLLVTDFSLNVSNPKNLPPAIKAQLLTNGQKATSALVFVSQLRNHLALVDAYQRISNHVAQVINLEHLLDSMIADELLNSHTFALVEKRLIAALRTELLAETLDWQRINQSIEARRSGYWLNLPNFGQLEAEQLAYKACYDALIAATSFRQLSQKYHAGFSFTDAHHALDSYTSELFLFDQLYRQYHRAAQQVKAATWSVLQPLSDRIEQDYIEWFLPHFSRAWSSVLEGEQGLLSTWQVNGWQAQQQFYAQKVKPYFNQGVKRVFVVISDALRYEAAEELVSQLNSKNRYKTRLDVMLGVLPSYTSLGMAALLPHQKLTYKRGQNGSLAVQADGLATAV